MLAKEIKIKNIKRQREYIRKQLEGRLEHPSIDGNTAYLYVGHILPEVITHFQCEGYDIRLINSDMLTAATKGLPIHLFTISDDVVLTKEELKAAEEVECDPDEDKSETPDIFGDLFLSLLGGR